MSANTDHVGKAYAGFARGDIPAILELLDDDVDWSAPGTLPQGGAFKGRDGVLKFFESIGAAWDQLTVQTEVIADVGDDTVVAIVDAAGTLRGGHAGGYGAVHVFTMRGGRIARFREFVDVDRPIGG